MPSPIIQSIKRILTNNISQFFVPKVSSRGPNDCLVHPGVHDGDESKGEQHHDDKVGYQDIVPAVGHCLSQFSGTNLPYVYLRLMMLLQYEMNTSDRLIVFVKFIS